MEDWIPWVIGIVAFALIIVSFIALAYFYSGANSGITGTTCDNDQDCDLGLICADSI